jgi:hypothetical protein
MKPKHPPGPPMTLQHEEKVRRCQVIPIGLPSIIENWRPRKSLWRRRHAARLDDTLKAEPFERWFPFRRHYSELRKSGLASSNIVMRAGFPKADFTARTVRSRVTSGEPAFGRA